MQLPEKGLSKQDVLGRMLERKLDDADWRSGRTWSLIYPAGNDVDEILREAANIYLFENALNPFRFPSLRKMEEDVVSMTAGLLNAPSSFGGSMTSGGTESILMAVKTARDRAKAELGITKPQILAPYSAHPAFAKAARYLSIELCQIPLGRDLRADVEAAKELVTDDTVLIAGSAPNYPHGMVDSIPELAGLAAERNILFHTDSCVGGFLLPFMERLGETIPPFDFRVEGVTSMSADVHKYGYATKGASVIIHRNGVNMQHQAFVYSDWPGGVYGSYAMAGARPAAPIAVAWAVMTFLGVDGYKRLVARVLEATRRLRKGIEALPGLMVFGEPVGSIISFGSGEFDVMAVGDVMDDKGWHLDRQGDPPALHLMVSPEHDRVVEDFLTDLRASVVARRESRGAEARYS